LLPELVLQLDVFEKKFVVIALHEPARPPRLGVAETKSVWMDFLSHNFLIVVRLGPHLKTFPTSSYASSPAFSSLASCPSPALLPSLRRPPSLRRRDWLRLFRPTPLPGARSYADSDTRVPSARDECASSADRRWRQHA